jgi:hypothetical protein
MVGSAARTQGTKGWPKAWSAGSSSVVRGAHTVKAGGTIQLKRLMSSGVNPMERIRSPASSALEFRAELFNALNHPQFDDPVVTSGNNPLAGKITSASDFGFTQTERVIQLGLKYSF